MFSAPNYCDVYNNKGAVIKFDVSIKSSYFVLILLIEQHPEHPTVQLLRTPLPFTPIYGHLHLVHALCRGKGLGYVHEYPEERE